MQEEQTMPLSMEQFRTFLIFGKWTSQVLGVLVELKIPDLLKDGPMSRQDIAKSTQAHPRSLYRLLRAATGIHVLASDGDNFALTPFGEGFCADNPTSAAEIVRYVNHDFSWRPWGKLLEGVKTGASPFEAVFGQDLFSYMKQDREVGAIFDEEMTRVSFHMANMLVAQRKFDNINHLIDIGGGRGEFLAHILQANPHLKGTLFDLPQVVEQTVLAEKGLSDRCNVVGGSFLESVPEGGDAYMLSHIIHDWDDQHSLQILDNIRKVLKPEGRILVVENLIAPESPFTNFLDLDMMVLMPGGRELSRDEYAALFNQAGLVLDTVTPLGAELYLLEAVPA